MTDMGNKQTHTAKAMSLTCQPEPKGSKLEEVLVFSLTYK